VTQSDQPIFRFAPSPNGRLHLGHALAALTGRQLARRHGGRFLLRIEDIDQTRSSPQLIDAIYEDLTWLGIDWDEQPLLQSTRFDAYRAAADQLRAGGLLYSCAATRKDIQAAMIDDSTDAQSIARDPDGAPRYQPICGARRRGAPPPCAQAATQNVGQTARFAQRLDMSAACDVLGDTPLHYCAWDGDRQQTPTPANPADWGDAVLLRKDTPASYHLAVVVDDAFQGVTHVVRGQDLERATDLHCLLQHLLGLPTPIYHHHRLLTAEDGRKLSKQSGDTALATLRQNGVTPTEIRAMVGF